MKLYRVTYIHPHEGTCYEWHPTAAAAKAALKSLKAENEGHDFEWRVESENVPVGLLHRDEMVKWLNRRFTRDNG